MIIDLAMFGQKADDTLSMAHSYMGNVGNQAADPWERVPRIGAGHGTDLQTSIYIECYDIQADLFSFVNNYKSQYNTW
jgi:hypothetical protein